MKPRNIYEILYRENGRSGSRNIYANSEEEATEAFFAERPNAEITDINESRNEPEYEHKF